MYERYLEHKKGIRYRVVRFGCYCNVEEYLVLSKKYGNQASWQKHEEMKSIESLVGQIVLSIEFLSQFTINKFGDDHFGLQYCIDICLNNKIMRI